MLVQLFGHFLKKWLKMNETIEMGASLSCIAALLPKFLVTTLVNQKFSEFLGFKVYLKENLWKGNQKWIFFHL